MDLVLVDPKPAAAVSVSERRVIAEMGVDLIELPIVSDADPRQHDPVRVVEALLSLV